MYLRRKIETLDDLAAIDEPIDALEKDPTQVTAVYVNARIHQKPGAEDTDVDPIVRTVCEVNHDDDTPPQRKTEQTAVTVVEPIRRSRVESAAGAAPATRAAKPNRVPGIFREITSVGEPLEALAARAGSFGSQSLEALATEGRRSFSAVAEAERFYERLIEEIGRAERGLTTFALLLVDLRLQPNSTIGEVDLVLSRALRSYDICCRITNTELGLLMPGVSSVTTAAAVKRLQLLLAELGVTATIGWASWSPGIGAEEMLKRARVDLCSEGGLEIEAPESGVERSNAMLWVEGFPHGLPVQASPRQGRLQLLVNLPFLQRGMPVCLSAHGACRTVTLEAATIVSGGRPLLRLEVS